MISDAYLSDSLDDAGPASSFVDSGREHRDGLVRGIVFVIVVLAPFVATFGPSLLAKGGSSSSAGTPATAMPSLPHPAH